MVSRPSGKVIPISGKRVSLQPPLKKAFDDLVRRVEARRGKTISRGEKGDLVLELLDLADAVRVVSPPRREMVFVRLREGIVNRFADGVTRGGRSL